MTASRGAADTRKNGAGAARRGRSAPAAFGLAASLSMLLAACAALPPAPGGPLDRLTGLKGEEVVALLGPPDLRRAEPPAELWQYRGRLCVLELYLYRDPDTYRVVHAESHDRLAAEPGRCGDAPAPLAPDVRQTRL
jgi:hypothetical protein